MRVYLRPLRERVLQEETHKFASVQANLPSEIVWLFQALGRSIPDALVKAREDKPHVTVRWGLETEDPDAVQQVLGQFGPITLTFGETAYFEPSQGSEGNDVVYVSVESPDLVRMNAALAVLPHVNTQPNYVPHATLAYVQAGVGEQFAGNRGLAGLDLTLDTLTLYGREDEDHWDIVLLGDLSD